MKLRTWGHAALLAALTATLAQGATAGRPQRTSDSQAGWEDALVEQASYDSCASCPTDCGGGLGLGGLMDRPIQIVAGAQYIYARANFSEALSYVELDTTGTTGNDLTFHQFDFDYKSSYNFYGGFNLCDCGGQVLFNYTRLSSDADFVIDKTSADQEYFTPYETGPDIIVGNTAEDVIGQQVRGFADVNMNSYDLSFAKTIPLGCPLSCGGGGCDTCCGDQCCGNGCDDACCGSGCGCGWCPAWDIQWSGGVRFANVDWTRGTTLFDPLPNRTQVRSATTTMNFDGFGGRIGLLGRRYLGKRGLFSLYAKGDWSLLMGEIEVNTLTVQGINQATINTRCDHIVPVTEIELGGTAHLTKYLTATGGYFWSAWHDLGMRDEYDFEQFQLSHYDDANILGWDGLFARVELAF